MTPALTPPLKNEASPWTIRESLAWAEATLKVQGIPDARLSAELILGLELGLDRIGLLTASNRSLPEGTWEPFEKKIIRRGRDEPVAYLLGEKEFWSLPFNVNPSVLIPRPETELLVEEALELLKEHPDFKTIGEAGTGSGAVIVALAKSMSPSRALQFWATDLSWPALQTARENARRHGVLEKIFFIQGDWLSGLSVKEPWLDLLLSNPPYVAEQEILQLPRTVKAYEPLKALRGGQDGLEGLRIIFNQAKGRLKKGAWLLLEIGETQAEPVIALARGHHFSRISIRRDYAGKDRILRAAYHG